MTGRPDAMALALSQIRGADHMNYSIRYQDDKGITERSEFLEFDSDAAASGHAELEQHRHFIVEIWKGEALLSRTFRDAPGS
jgi:hypothetical protein